MKRIRCVIADMSHQMLADIVQDNIEQTGFIEVVKRVHDARDIAEVIARENADVLIFSIDNQKFVSACAEIMISIPDILIIGLVDDGRRLALAYDNVGHNDIVNIIHVLRYPVAEHAS